MRKRFTHHKWEMSNGTHGNPTIRKLSEVFATESFTFNTLMTFDKELEFGAWLEAEALLIRNNDCVNESMRASRC